MSEMTWQPIETAPKDGTWIKHLAANGTHLRPLAWAYSPNAKREAWCGLVMGCLLPCDPQPTHWLPEQKLPAPPEAAE